MAHNSTIPRKCRWCSPSPTGEVPQLCDIRKAIKSLGENHSTCQVCRSDMNGQWKVAKHILICMTLRHPFWGAELITFMNRFVHSENYSFSLELETAIAQTLEQTSSFPSAQIIRQPNVPSVLHSDFDNFDQFISSLTSSAYSWYFNLTFGQKWGDIFSGWTFLKGKQFIVNLLITS